MPTGLGSPSSREHDRGRYLTVIELYIMAFSFGNITHVQPGYFFDCITNFACTIPGIPLNILVLYISMKPNALNGATEIRYSIIGMTFYTLYGAIGLSILYSWYLLSLYYNTAMTVLTCSLIRRILGSTLSSAHISILIVTIDRYALIVWNMNFSAVATAVLFGSIFIYVHVIMNTLQFAFNEFGVEDICGPTAKMPFIASLIVLPVVPLSIIAALIMNFCILSHLYRYNRKVALSALKINKLNYWKNSMYGLLAQTLMLCIFVLPETIGEALFFIDSTIQLPHTFWISMNGATCIYFSLNPIVTLISVRQFRMATRKIFCISNGSNTVASLAQPLAQTYRAMRKTNVSSITSPTTHK